MIEIDDSFIKGLKNRKNIKIDVGVSIDGPHAATWLLTEADVFVIGVEPHPENISTLRTGREHAPFPYLVLDDKAVRVNGNVAREYEESQFLLVEGAIDNVGDTPQKRKFYCTSDINTGCSSLLKPTEELKIPVEKEIEVDVYSLEYILDTLELQDVEIINFVKTDTQGKDLDVVKSLGGYLSRVVALKCEYNVGQMYEGAPPHDELFEYMKRNNFHLSAADGADALFFNKRFLSTHLALPRVFNLPELQGFKI